MKIFHTLTLFLFSLSGLSQLKQTEQVTLKWSPKLQIDQNEIFVDYAGSDKLNHYYITRNKKFEYSLLKLNKDLENVGFKRISLKNKKYKMEYESCKLINNTLYFFRSFANKKDGLNYLFSNSIDKENLQLNPDIKKIDQVPYIKTRNKGNFHFICSPNQEKVLIKHDLKLNPNGAELFGFTVLNSDMSEVYSKQIEINSGEKSRYVEDFILNNNGDVILVVIDFIGSRPPKVDNGKRITYHPYYYWRYYRKRVSRPNYSYSVLIYNDDREEKITFSDSTRFITDLKVDVSNANSISCFGLFSSKDNYLVKGAFTKTFDGITLEQSQSSFNAFDQTIYDQIFEDRNSKKLKAQKKEALFKDLILYPIIKMKNGNSVLLAESYYTFRTYSRVPNGAGGSTVVENVHYVFEDIIICEFSPDNSLTSLKIIDKYQESINDLGINSSFTSISNGDKISFIFNESAKKIFSKEQIDELDRKNKREYYCLLASQDKNGDYEKKSLFKWSEEKLLFTPQFSRQFEEQLAILYTYRSALSIFVPKAKDRKFVEINFK